MKKISITIGVPAYNEEKNILNLIASINEQRGESYKIEKIIIISDGSTDSTVILLNELKQKKIKIIGGTKRLGKPYRLNQLFKISKSDVLVLLDSDVILGTYRSLEQLIKPFIYKNNIGIVSGKAIPIKGITFIEKAVNTSYEAYDKLKTKINNGSNPWAAEGRIMALSKNFLKKTKIPNSMIAVDNYLYFWCITNGYSFVFSRNASVLYRSPATLAGHIRQNTRFLARENKLHQIFGNIVKKQYALPFQLKVKIFFLSFIKSPIYSSSIYLINIYCRYRANKMSRNINSLWIPLISTKKAIQK